MHKLNKMYQCIVLHTLKANSGVHKSVGREPTMRKQEYMYDANTTQI